MKTSGLLPLLLALAGTPVSFAQDNSAAPPVSAEEARAKALRYYDALVKRPTGGYLFDRFYNAWLDTQTLDELEAYLTQRAEAADAATGHRLVLAFFHMRQNASARALALFAKALEKDPGNAEAWFQKAVAESRASNVDQALQDLEKSLAAKPSKETSREARQLQGRLLVRAGKTGEAAKVWETLLAENPTDEDLQEDLVEIQLMEGLTDDALKTALGLLEKTKDPYKRVQRRLRAGDIQSRLGNRDAAISAYVECLGDVGGDSWLEREILSQIEQVYRKDDAITDLRGKMEELIRQHPQRVALRRTLAKVQSELGDGEAAIKTWKELLPLAPGDRSLREAFVQMLAENKKIAEAVTQLESLITQEPNDAELRMQLAEFQWRANKKDECVKALQQFLEKSDQTTEAAALRAAAQMERYELKDAALALYAATAAKYPASETASLGSAAALHRAGKAEEARAAWRKLAAAADGPRLAAIARSVASREEHKLAEELLSARLAEFMKDASYLQFYCETALRAEKEQAAVAPARALLNLARDTVALDSALANAVRVLERAAQIAAVAKEIEAAPGATLPDKCLLAELLDRGGEPAKAATVLQEVAKTDPVTGNASLVRIHMARGDFKKAAEFQEALVNAPGGRKAVHLQRLVELCEKSAQYDRALQWTAEWRKAAPGSVQAWIKESDLLTAAGKMQDALRVMRQASQQFPADEDIRMRLAEAFRTEGKFADAQRIYTMLFEDAKDTANKVRYAGELAKTADLSGGTTPLVEQFEERRRGNRGSILPLLALAEIHRNTGNYEGRRQALLEANRIRQGDPDLLFELARIEESEGKFESALETLQEAKKLDKSGRADERIVRVLFAAGRDQEGLQIVFRNAGGEKMDPRTAEDMVQDLLKMGLHEEALTLLDQLLPQNPADYRLGYLRLSILLELEKFDEGLASILKLLEAKTEMTPPAAAQGQGPGQMYRNRSYGSYDLFTAARVDSKVASKVPPGTLEIIRFRRMVQNFRPGSSRGYYSGYSYSDVYLPWTLQQLQDSVIPMALTILEELPAARRAPFWKEVAGRIALPAALLGPDGLRVEQLKDGEFENLAAVPDASPELLAAAVLTGAAKDRKVAERAWDTFKDSLPAVAWTSLPWILAADTPEDALRPVQEATQRLREMKEVPDMSELEAMGGASSASYFVENSTIRREFLDLLSSRMMEWRDRVSGDPAYQQMFRNRAAFFRASILERTDIKAWVELLEAETDRLAKEEPVRQPDQANLNFPQGILWPLAGSSLPGRCAILSPSGDISENISIRTARGGTYSQSTQAGGVNEEAAGRYREALKLARHPSVRIAFRLLLDPADGEGVMEEIKNSGGQQVYHAALKAAWARRQEKMEEAVKALDEAAAVPGRTARELKALDELKVTFALETSEDSSAGTRFQNVEPLMKSAKEAVARLAALPGMTSSDFSRLSGMTSVFGMDAVSKQLMARAQAGSQKGQQQQASRSRLGSYYGQSNASSQAAQLLDKGRRDLALRLISRSLKNLARNNSGGNEDYYSREWVQLINRHQLSEVLQESFKIAGDESSPEKIRRSAYVLGLTGSPAEAAKLWKKLLEVRPDDPQAITRVITTSFTENEEMGRKLLSEIKPEQYGNVGFILGRIVGASNNTVVDQVALATSVAEMLERVKPEDYGKVWTGWVKNFVDNFARAGRLNRNSLPSLYVAKVSGDRNGNKSAELEKELKKRRDVMNRILDAALKIPGSARDAVTIRLAFRMAEGANDEELFQLVRDALLREARGPVGAYPLNNGSTSYGASGAEIPITEPEAILARRAFAAGNAAIMDDLVKELQEAREASVQKASGKPALRGPRRTAPVYNESVARYRTLYFGTEKEVLTMLRSMGWPGQPMMEVYTAMERRRMDPALSDMVEKYMRANHYEGSGIASAQLRFLLDVKKDRKAAQVFMERIAEIFLGPPAKRSAVISSGNSNSYYYLNLYADRGGAARSFFLTDQFWRQYGRFVPKKRSNQNGNEWKISGKDLLSAPEAKAALEVLRESPFLTSIEEFTPLPRVGERTLFESCAETVGKFPAAVKDGIVKSLNSGTVAPGTELFIAAMAEKPGAALLETASKHAEAFRKLPAEKGPEWSWLASRITQDVKPESLSGPQKAFMEWLNQFSADPAQDEANPGSDKQIETFLAAKSLLELGVQYHELDEWVPANLGAMLDAKPERTADIYRKYRQLLGAVSRSGGSYSYYFENPLQDMLQKRNLKKELPAAALQELRGMVDAWLAPEGYPLPFPLVTVFASTRLDLVSRGPADKGKQGPMRADILADALKKHFEEKHLMILLPWVSRVVEQMAVHDKPAVKEAIQKVIDTAPDQWTSRLLRLAVDMRMYRHEPWRKRDADTKAAEDARKAAAKAGKSEAEVAAMPDPKVVRRGPVFTGIADRGALPPYQSALAAFAEDRNVNVSVRSGVLLESVSRDEASEPALVMTAMRTLAESWRAGTPVMDQHFSMLASRLTQWLRMNGVKASAEYKTAFREAIASWRVAIRKPGGRADTSYGYTPPTLLDLALALEDDDTVSALIAVAPEQMNVRWIVRLLAAGKREPAVRILQTAKDGLLSRAAFSGYDEQIVDPSLWLYTSAVDRTAAEFLKSLESAPQRALAAALFAIQPDAPGLAPRAERLKAAAALLPPPSGGAGGEFVSRAVNVLSGDDGVRALIAPQLAEAVKGFSLVALAGGQSDAVTQRKLSLLEAHYANEAAAGRVELLKKEITALAKLQGGSEYQQARALGRTAKRIITATNTALPGMTDEGRAANRALWGELMVGPLWYGSYDNQAYSDIYSNRGRLFHAVLLYAHDDKMDEWRKLLGAQPQAAQDRLLELWRQMDLNDEFKNIAGWQWPKDAKELEKVRSKLTARLIQSRLGLPGYYRLPSASWLRDRIKQRILTKEDLYSVEDIFRKDDGNSRTHSGNPAIELAELHFADGDRAKAEDWLKVAEAQLDKSGPVPYFGNLMGRARLMKSMGDAPGALALLQSAGKEMLESAEFTKDRKAPYERLMNELDTEVLSTAGPDKAMAIMAERVQAAPEDPGNLGKFITVAEMLGRLSAKDGKWAEAADWHMLCSAAVTRLGARDKELADADRAGGQLEQAAVALTKAGTAAPDFMTLVPRGASWHYLDNGTVPPAGWHDHVFDDSKWPTGAAPFGYGDPDMGTEIKPGGPDATHFAMTAVARHTFDLKDVSSIRYAELRYRVDDGCVVFLNGKEIVRRNMPEGNSIDHTTPALKSISANEELRYHVQQNLDTSLFKAGPNVIAVEVHQDKPTSSDLVFDAALVCNVRGVEEVYADYWKRPMSPAVGAFWQKLPEAFRKMLQDPPAPPPAEKK